jgi:hypothetical protein
MDTFLIRKPAITADDEITKSTKQPEPHLSSASTSAIISEQNKTVDSNIVCKDLNDISANEKKLIQHKSSANPKNKDKRSFQAEWFQRFQMAGVFKKWGCVFLLSLSTISFPRMQIKRIYINRVCKLETGFK